jgi:uncharacterized heparinase superfamily protein
MTSNFIRLIRGYYHSATRYVHTLRHLRPLQLFWQVHYRIWPKRKPAQAPAPPLRVAAKPLAALPERRPVFGPNHLHLLHRDVPITLLENGWRVPGQSDLWHYHLHYFEDVVASDAPKRRVLQQKLIDHWIAHNPPLTPVSWDAYPISRRSCYWMLAESQHPGLLNETRRNSLAVQLRHLANHLEKHLLANHLFANLKALWIASCFFEGAEAEQWRQLASPLLARELAEQFLPDGAHYEIAPMYHALLLEDVLDILNIAERYATPPPRGMREIVPRALAYLQHVTHPDGRLAHFHDTAQQVAPCTTALAAYAARLGITPETMPLHHAIMRLQKNDWSILFDGVSHGPSYQPGHTHAEALSIELSYAGERVLVNQGTSSYARGTRRSYERSTAAHNTLVLNDANSCDVWASFRVGKRARLHGSREMHDHGDYLSASAAQDGYRPVIHRRQLELKDTSLRIIDMLDGEGSHEVTLYLHGAPGVAMHPTHITTPNGTVLQLKSWGEPEPFSSQHGVSFHHRVSTSSLVIKARVRLPWEGVITLSRAPSQ